MCSLWSYSWRVNIGSYRRHQVTSHCLNHCCLRSPNYSGVIMSTMVPQITSVWIVYSTVCSVPDQRKHQSPASLAFVRGIYRWPVNSPHKGPVTRKMFPFDDVIMEKSPCGGMHYHHKESRNGNIVIWAKHSSLVALDCLYRQWVKSRSNTMPIPFLQWGKCGMRTSGGRQTEHLLAKMNFNNTALSCHGMQVINHWNARNHCTQIPPLSSADANSIHITSWCIAICYVTHPSHVDYPAKVD